jgi:FYVE/RhoGEF/PH domain-containing protein 5/6
MAATREPFLTTPSPTTKTHSQRINPVPVSRSNATRTPTTLPGGVAHATSLNPVRNQQQAQKLKTQAVTGNRESHANESVHRSIKDSLPVQEPKVASARSARGERNSRERRNSKPTTPRSTKTEAQENSDIEDFLIMDGENNGAQNNGGQNNGGQNNGGQNNGGQNNGGQNNGGLNQSGRLLTQGFRTYTNIIKSPIVSTTMGPNNIPLMDPRTVSTDEEFDKIHELPEVDWSDKMSKREKIAQEICTTERTYIRQLQKVILLYRYTLYATNPYGFTPALHKLEKMFNFIDEIINLNKMLYTRLTECFKEGVQFDRIGDAFDKLVPFFKLYTQYTEGYNDVVHVVKDEKLRDPSFANVLDAMVKHPLARNLDLDAFLILPVQRIPRYMLLLTDLLRNTEPEHPDYKSLKDALEKMKIVADHIEDSIAAAENRQKCLAIQNSFLLGDVKVLQPHRRFIRDGILVKQCRKERKERMFYLFTDCLMYAFESVPGTAKYILSGEIPLSVLTVTDIPDDPSHLLQNTLKFEAKGKSFYVFAPTLQEKISWFTCLTDAKKSLEEKKQTFNKGKDPAPPSPDNQSKAPIWVPDAQVNNCAICKQAFGFTVRKHHCRNCGEVVCGPCSRGKKIVKAVSDYPERVCTNCEKKLT